MGFLMRKNILFAQGFRIRQDLGMMPRPLAEVERDKLLGCYEVRLLDTGQRGQMPGGTYYLFQKQRSDADTP